MRLIVVSNLGFATAVVFLLLTAVDSTPAQDKGLEQRKTGTTIDAWKEALPQLESANDATSTVRVAEWDSPVEIEKSLNDLERDWMIALKAGNSGMLKRLLAPEFTLSSTKAAQGWVIGRNQYLKQNFSDWRIESHGLDGLEVHVYGNTAVVHGWYKQQPAVVGEGREGDFLFTDVWVQRAGNWKAVSRHLSQLAASREKVH